MKSLKERFDEKYQVEANTGCWLWTGAVTKIKGSVWCYGVISIDNKKRVATRASWFLTHGYLPSPDIQVLHKCDTPLCVNPNHLFLGTQADNMADCERKGRKNVMFGERAGMSKLTDAIVASIRNDTRTFQEIAKEHDIHESTVAAIRYNRTWKHVPVRAKNRGRPKVTEEMVRSIRASDELHEVIAREHGISKTSVCLIRTRKTWDHVT
jgi:hypothetical protein